jgi:hypothetical protein
MYRSGADHGAGDFISRGGSGMFDNSNWLGEARHHFIQHKIH